MKKYKYEDMYFLDRPISNRSKMSMKKRAAQFSPFAALVGHQDAVNETARIVKKKIVLDDNIKELIDYKLREVIEDIEICPIIKVIYFAADERKVGGRYEKYEGAVKKIDVIDKKIIFCSNKIILISDLFAVEY